MLFTAGLFQRKRIQLVEQIKTEGGQFWLEWLGGSRKTDRVPPPGVPRTLGWGVERASDSLVQNMRFPLLFFSSSLTLTHVTSC